MNTVNVVKGFGTIMTQFLFLPKIKYLEMIFLILISKSKIEKCALTLLTLADLELKYLSLENA